MSLLAVTDGLAQPAINPSKLMILNAFKIAALLLGIAFIFFFNRIMVSIHHFLEITSPIDAQVLVVEGWLSGFDYTLPEVLKEYQRGNYDYIVASSSSGRAKSGAEECAEKLRALGVDRGKIISVTGPPLKKYKVLLINRCIENILLS